MNFTLLTSPPPSSYRSAAAPSSLPPGSVISRELPFAFSLFPSFSDSFCSKCLTPVDEGSRKRCSGGCLGTFYCSKSCQVSDRSVHKHTCKRFSTAVDLAASACPNLPLDELLLLRRVYFLCLSSSSSPKGTVPPLSPSLSSLCKTDPLSPPSFASGDVSLSLAASRSLFLPPSSSPFFLDLLSRFRCNNFAVVTPLQYPVAHAIYPTAAILNHSCAPNCVLTYEEGSVQVIRTIEQVAAGEELFHSYCDVTSPTAVRRKHLKEVYGFDCDCPRCTGAVGVADELLTQVIGQGLTEKEEAEVERCLRRAGMVGAGEGEEDDVEKEYGLICRALEIQRAKLGPLNVDLYKTQGLALSVSMLLSSPSSLSHASHLVTFLSAACGSKNHPLLLLQQMTLSELKENSGDLEGAKAMYGDIADGCEITYGADHEYTRRYRRLLK